MKTKLQKQKISGLNRLMLFISVSVAFIALSSFIAMPLPGNTDVKVIDKTFGDQTVRQVVNQLYGADSRDNFFNPKRKVDFEVELAVLLLKNANLYQDAVFKISKKMLEYIDNKEKQKLGSTTEDLKKMLGQPTYFGRLTDKIENEAQYLKEIRDIMANGKGTLSNHLFLHLQFMDNIYSADFKSGTASKLLGKDALEPKFLRKHPLVAAYFENRGRMKPGAEGSRVTDFYPKGSPLCYNVYSFKSDTTTTIVSDALVAQYNLKQKHTRGIDLWTLDETNPFVQDARIKWNMPVACCISGTTADLLECATVLGTKEVADYQNYATGVLSYLMIIGAHTFHEIISAATTVNIKYQAGNYRNVLPKAVTENADFKALQTKYPDLIGN